METLALIVLIIFSLTGFAAIFFTTFGTLILLAGAILYAALTGFSIISIKALFFLGALYFVGEVLEYFSIIFGAKQLAASNAAIGGAIVGGIVGAAFGSAFFGVGLIAGAFLGIFAGAFIVELFVQRDLIKSLKAGTGSILGRVGSIFAKLVIAFAMLFILIKGIINHGG